MSLIAQLFVHFFILCMRACIRVCEEYLSYTLLAKNLNATQHY